MFVSGGTAITLADKLSWGAVCIGLALLFLPMMVITALAPEPAVRFEEPKSLREAIWNPFIGFLSRDRALEILAFVLLYKFADNFAQSLLRPFLVDMGYSAAERGVALSLVGLWTQIGGALLGGIFTNLLGLGRALWVFGLLQVISNAGYLYLANTEHSTVAMVVAMGFETLCQGLGTGAFSVLLLRMTQKRFSATQYALFSTLFGMGRIFSGPVAGFTVDSVGWSWFFIASMVLGIPGLVMLHRFVPFGIREPEFEVREQEALPPLERGALLRIGLIFGAVSTLACALLLAVLSALKELRAEDSAGFDLQTPLLALVQPEGIVGWVQLIGLLAVGVSLGLMAAATAVARRGGGVELAREALREEQGLEAAEDRVPSQDDGTKTEPEP
jgi:PAT family beta-lactamase induction signal transducer AmpG